MILLLDIGNSRMKWAMARGTRPGRVAALPHAGDPAACIHRLPEKRVAAVWIAQVLGPEAQRAIGVAVRERFGTTPAFARVRREHLGLRIAYRQPARLGVDRWLSLLALWTARQDGFCVASAGTALTFDAVDRQGRHAGGLIASGLHTAERAVLGATRFPQGRRIDRYTRGLGRDTASCVRQGALFACAGLLDRAVADITGARYLTGGDARRLRPHLSGRWTLRENLVLEGLLALAQDGLSHV